MAVALEGYDDSGTATGRTVLHEGTRPLPDLEIRVPRGVVGDLVLARIEHKSPHGPVAWARLEQVLEPSPERVAPACPVAAECGGCPWLQVAYPAQLREKWGRAARVAEELGLGRDLVEIEPSPTVLGFRGRGKFVVARRRGRVLLGAWKPRSHDFVRTAECPALEPAVAETAQQLEAVLSGRRIPVAGGEPSPGSLRYVGIRSNWRGEVLVTAVTQGPPVPRLRRALREFQEARAQVVGVTADLNESRGNVIFSGRPEPVAGRMGIQERFGDVEVELLGHSFSQVNRQQAEQLYAFALGRLLRPLGRRKVRRIWDLFSGAGFLGLAAARRGVRVWGVEVDAETVARANRAAERLGLGGQCRFVAGDAASLVGRAPFSAQALLLNPPRSGCPGPLLLELGRLRVPRIVYVSCNPRTLGRDAGFLRTLGYYVTDLRAFDMMPHTPHLELVAVLQHPGG